MQTLKRAALAGLLAAALAPAAGAAVDVTFVEPEGYTDASLNGRFGRDAHVAATGAIARHLAKLGSRYLAPTQRLEVEVLDVDLAGRYEPWRPYAHDVRFLTGVTWPKIRLRYTLRAGDAVLARAEETVMDQTYLWNPVARRSLDMLAYEKAMLDDWFRRRFGGGRS